MQHRAITPALSAILLLAAFASGPSRAQAVNTVEARDRCLQFGYQQGGDAYSRCLQNESRIDLERSRAEQTRADAAWRSAMCLKAQREGTSRQYCDERAGQQITPLR